METGARTVDLLLHALKTAGVDVPVGSAIQVLSHLERLTPTGKVSEQLEVWANEDRLAGLVRLAVSSACEGIQAQLDQTIELLRRQMAAEQSNRRPAAQREIEFSRAPQQVAETLAKPRPRVFLAHRHADKEAAAALAAALRAYGIDVWFSHWEIAGGDNLVEKMEDGLQRAHGALVFLSANGIENSWTYEEYSAALLRVREHRGDGTAPFVLPVLHGPIPPETVPLFLRTRSGHAAHEVDKIATSILKHCGYDVGGKPPLGGLWLPTAPEELHIEIRREGDAVVLSSGELSASVLLPTSEATALRGRIRATGVVRDAAQTSLESGLSEVGRRLAPCFQGGIGMKILDAVRRNSATLRLRSDDADLLALPWEAAYLEQTNPMGLVDRLSVVRELDTKNDRIGPIPGPLRLLVALAVPDDSLDVGRELDVILSAVDKARHGRPRTVFIDADLPTLEGIRAHLDAEPFHVVHLSAHGTPNALQLEGADGTSDPVSAEKLASVLLGSKHPPPVVVLSACSSGVGFHQASIAQRLIEAGVSQVVAMHGTVSDGYATELAGHFYASLAVDTEPSCASALAEARQTVERLRRECSERGQAYAASQPEYATAVLYAAASRGASPLYDGRTPLGLVDETSELVGVPGLNLRPLGWLVGRRTLRRALRATITDPKKPGALLTGMGGIGKSALAATTADRMARAGWQVVVHVGSFCVDDLARAVRDKIEASGLSAKGRNAWERLRAGVDARGRLSMGSDGAVPLGEGELDDRGQFEALGQLLHYDRVLVLLDNFEDNLVRDPLGLPVHWDQHAARLDDGLTSGLRILCAGASRGSLLVTCRYPVADLELEPHTVEPLDVRSLRQLVWRLPGLQHLPPAELDELFTTLGGHPRVLEFADALLRAAPGRWTAVFDDVRRRAEQLASTSGEELPHELDDDEPGRSPESQLMLARRLAARDVLLPALLETLPPAARQFLEAVSVFRHGVPADALAEVSSAVGLEISAKEQRAFNRLLHARTLLAATGPGERVEAGTGRAWSRSWLVHRWTADAIQREMDETVLRSAHRAAAKWWLGPRSLAWEHAMEGVEHLLSAGDHDEASEYAHIAHTWAERCGQSSGAGGLCKTLINRLPINEALWSRWMGTLSTHLARNHDAVGALSAAEAARQAQQQLVEREPGRTDFLRDLSVSYNNLGDLHRALGNGDQARSFFDDALSIRKQLVEREPELDQYQGDLALSYERMAVVEPANATSWLEEAISIHRKRLERSPANVRTHRELSVTLVSLARHAANEQEMAGLLGEAYQRLEALAQREALEAEYRPLLEGLASMFRTAE